MRRSYTPRKRTREVNPAARIQTQPETTADEALHATQDFEEMLMREFASVEHAHLDTEDDSDCDPALEEQRQAATQALKKHKDDALEMAATEGMNIGSQSAMAKRFLIWAAQTGKKAEYDALRYNTDKRKMREAWLQDQWDEYQDHCDKIISHLKH